MMFICFNHNCNRWGEGWSGKGIPEGHLLTWPMFLIGAPCEECGKPKIWHDNWESDQRRHDDGTRVTDVP